MRTLGGIARLLGVDGKTVTQYRAAIEARVHDREQRGSRTPYRVSQVVDAINKIRRGRGLRPIRNRTADEDRLADQCHDVFHCDVFANERCHGNRKSDNVNSDSYPSARRRTSSRTARVTSWP